jgi:hypothetical protein
MVMAFFDLMNTASKEALTVYTAYHSNDGVDFIRMLALNLTPPPPKKNIHSITAKINRQVMLFVGIQDMLYWSNEPQEISTCCYVWHARSFNEGITDAENGKQQHP